MKTYKRVLTIAGSDSGGCAGVQADMKTISACGCFATSAITAITVQNTCGVRSVHLAPADIVAGQIEAVLEDIGTDAVKLGMLPSAEIAERVAGLLRRFEIRNIVLDPVMVATSGDELIPADAAHAIIRHLLPLATVITPNVPETAYMTGLNIESEADFPEAAARLKALGAQGVLLKAGHLKNRMINDYLCQEDRLWTYSYERTDTPNTHGTGCTLSSAIASFLAHGHPLHEAVARAEEYIHKAIRSGAEYRLGNGHGPVHHFFRFWE